MSRSIKLSSDAIEFSHKNDAPKENLSLKECHDDYEFVYIINGNGSYVVEGEKIVLKPNTLVFLRPFEYHCVNIVAGCNYERYVLRFSSDFVVDKAKEILDVLSDCRNGESGIVSCIDENSAALLSVFEKIQTSLEDGNVSDENLKSSISELLILVSSGKYEKIMHDECALPTRVTRYINQYILRDVSLEVISKRFFLSKYYLCRMFKKHIGVTVHSYISQKRVFYAKQMIESGETASNAAYLVGFGDYSAFYRAYVKLVGKTPSVK